MTIKDKFKEVFDFTINSETKLNKIKYICENSYTDTKCKDYIDELITDDDKFSSFATLCFLKFISMKRKEGDTSTFKLFMFDAIRDIYEN